MIGGRDTISTTNWNPHEKENTKTKTLEGQNSTKFFPCPRSEARENKHFISYQGGIISSYPTGAAGAAGMYLSPRILFLFLQLDKKALKLHFKVIKHL